jgi:hypothetical protein
MNVERRIRKLTVQELYVQDIQDVYSHLRKLKRNKPLLQARIDDLTSTVFGMMDYITQLKHQLTTVRVNWRKKELIEEVEDSRRIVESTKDKLTVLIAEIKDMTKYIATIEKVVFQRSLPLQDMRDQSNRELLRTHDDELAEYYDDGYETDANEYE